jgi:hypothetical protein
VSGSAARGAAGWLYLEGLKRARAERRKREAERITKREAQREAEVAAEELRLEREKISTVA